MVGKDFWQDTRQFVQIDGVEYRIPVHYRRVDSQPPEPADVQVFEGATERATCLVHASPVRPQNVGPFDYDQLVALYSARLAEGQRLVGAGSSRSGASLYAFVIIEERLEEDAEEGADASATEAEAEATATEADAQYECILSLDFASADSAVHFQGYFDAAEAADALAAAQEFLACILGNCITG